MKRHFFAIILPAGMNRFERGTIYLSPAACPDLPIAIGSVVARYEPGVDTRDGKTQNMGTKWNNFINPLTTNNLENRALSFF
jgi:hypothetical protein